MKALSEHEVAQVSGAVSRADVLNYGAAVTAVGAAALGGLALVSASPAIAVAATAYGLVSGTMWLGSTLYSVGIMGDQR